MLYLGCHLSSSKGFLQMGKTALSIGTNTFQFFTRNPRGSRAKELDPADAAALRALMEENSFSCVVAHAPYTLNACSSAAQTRETIEIDGVTYPMYKLDTSSASHPFYTGAQTRIVEAGRVEKFRAKFAAKQQAMNAAAEAAKAAK